MNDNRPVAKRDVANRPVANRNVAHSNVAHRNVTKGIFCFALGIYDIVTLWYVFFPFLIINSPFIKSSALIK